MTRIAVVTGANRGISFETCRRLEKAGLDGIFTSRDPVSGKQAAAALRGEGREINYHGRRHDRLAVHAN